MKIGVVTTWNVKCGIAEYSRDLIYSLIGYGADVRVIAIGDKERIYPDEDFVKRQEPIDLRGLDILHIQNQGSFWSKEWLEGLLEKAKIRGIKTIVTFHDSAVWDGFDFSNIDEIIVHREEILPLRERRILGMGMIDIPVQICSFGIGRNDNRAIQEMCYRLGFKYNIYDPKDEWLSEAELMNNLKKNDAIVLWYGEVGIVGCSAGIRTAISSRRPVFISSVRWFDDVPLLSGVYRSRDIEDLEESLRLYFKDTRSEYMKINNWMAIAGKHLDIYEGSVK
ncbi:MAG: hypothetical protein M0R80_18420 [Proteobacteria bacterium]|jgi:hypothetical protein|nr:hypothetical protein [Pseudomonadota bacterium]